MDVRADAVQRFAGEEPSASVHEGRGTEEEKKKHAGPFQAMLGNLKTNVAKVSTKYAKPCTLGEGVRRTASP